MNARGRVLLLFALAMVTGAVWYLVLATEPALPGLCITWLCALAVFIRIQYTNAAPFILAVIIGLFGAVTGALSAKLATLRVNAPVLDRVIGPVMLEGWVEGIEPGGRGVRLRLLVHAIDGLARANTPRHIRLTHRTSLEVEIGRFVRCWAVVRPVPAPALAGDYAFDRQAWYEGLHAVGYVQGRCRGGTLGKPAARTSQFDLWIARQRRALALYVEEMAGANGFAAAMASGDRSFMSVHDRDALRGSGLAHLLAISGLHMGIVGGLIYLLVWRILALIEPLALRFTLRKPAAIAALVACVVYLVISGASVSTQRAFIMSAIFFGAILFDRVALSLQSFAIAMIATIIVAPWSVLTPGFQMSFAATGGLIAAYEIWSQNRIVGIKKSRIGFWFKSLVLTSIITSFATMPFALYHFNRIAGFGGLPANVLAMPIISLISAPLAAIAVMAAPFGLSGYPLWAFGVSLEAVLQIAHFFNGLYPAGIRVGHHMPPASLIFLTIALAGGSFLNGTRQRLIVALFCCLTAMALWGFSSSPGLYWSQSGDIYLVDKAGHTRRIAFIRGDGLPPLRYGSAPKTGTCPQDETCIIRLEQARVLLLGADAPICRLLPDDTRAVLAHQQTNCAFGSMIPFVTWADVQAENGVFLRLKDGHFIRQKPAGCTRRPWRTCAPASRPPGV